MGRRKVKNVGVKDGSKYKQKIRVEVKSWVDIFQFENSKAFKDSDIAKKLDKEF